MTSVSKIIRHKRISQGDRQFDVAVAIGHDPSLVCRWERGSKVPELSSLWKLADYFNCSLDELVGREVQRV